MRSIINTRALPPQPSLLLLLFLLFLLFWFFTHSTNHLQHSLLPQHQQRDLFSLSLKPTTSKGLCFSSSYIHTLSHTHRLNLLQQQWILTGAPFASSIFPSPGSQVSTAQTAAKRLMPWPHTRTSATSTPPTSRAFLAKSLPLHPCLHPPCPASTLPVTTLTLRHQLRP